MDKSGNSDLWWRGLLACAVDRLEARPTISCSAGAFPNGNDHLCSLRLARSDQLHPDLLTRRRLANNSRNQDAGIKQLPREGLGFAFWRGDQQPA